MCIGCAGPQLAQEFVKQLKLQHTGISFIEDRSQMPKWGQLGCNGFIVFDSNQKLISDATSALNQVGELAFRHVESLLDALVMDKAAPKINPGQFITVTGLKGNPALNGHKGICMSGAAPDSGRYAVRLQNGKQLSIKADNLILMAPTEEEYSDSEGSEPEDDGAKSGS